MKICVYAIMKNESWCIRRFLEHIGHDTMVVIGDTGSTKEELDKCYEVTKDFPHVAIFPVGVSPWRFDVARDTVLSLLPLDTDICISLDLDECLQPGWRAELEAAWVPGTTRLNYMFDWGCGIAFYYQKIHARKGYKWKNPVHEFPMPYGIVEKYANVRPDYLMVKHEPNGALRPAYLPMLKMSVEEDPNEPRNAFYYARELAGVGQWDESIKQADRYLALPSATWQNERCYAMRVKGRAYKGKGDMEAAYSQFMLAAKEAPTTREPWYELSSCAHDKGQWAEGLAFGLKCLSIASYELLYTVDPNVWKGDPHSVVALCAWWLGYKDLALTHGRLACEKSPENELFKRNLGFYEKG